MRWKKLGQIFSPNDYMLPNGCIGFSQAPQAYVMDDRVRVYFTGRQLESDGRNYVGHVCYADFDTAFSRCLGVSGHQILGVGKAGCFDEHGVFPLHVKKLRSRLFGYISGVSRRVSVPADGAIGISESFDNGSTFRRLGDGPILAPSLHEPCIVVDPFVLDAGDHVHMWYVYGVGWNAPSNHHEPDRVYKIGHAISVDGIDWSKQNHIRTIPDRLDENECQAMPTVARIGEKYHMLFCYRHASDFRTNRQRGYRIGHAESVDLIDWKRDDSVLSLAPSNAGWDSEMVCYPHMFWHDGRLLLLYNGNAFGRYGFGLAVLELDDGLESGR